MFISLLDLFKIGIGPSSSHTIGPMLAARRFVGSLDELPADAASVRCVLRGSLAWTGEGHATDRAILLGMHGYEPEAIAETDIEALVSRLQGETEITLANGQKLAFNPERDIVFDRSEPLPEHPNGMIFELRDDSEEVLQSWVVFSIGGGFLATRDELAEADEEETSSERPSVPYPFETAKEMLRMADESGLSIAAMKRVNEETLRSTRELDAGIDAVWRAMRTCIENGLRVEGHLPGGLNIKRRASALAEQLRASPQTTSVNDWLCAYAMAVNEENAAGHLVVTAPTNGAAGVIPAVLQHHLEHQGGVADDVATYLLTAAAIGGLIKHRSSISGAEVGCQGEVGSASAMAAAGLCAVRGGTPQQVEQAAEIALEHHLGMTCDPVAGLVQVPCIERNGFGACKAHVAASLALRGDGSHYMPLDNCIAAMKQTGQEMSSKFKETSQGGLAVSLPEC